MKKIIKILFIVFMGLLFIGVYINNIYNNTYINIQEKPSPPTNTSEELLKELPYENISEESTNEIARKYIGKKFDSIIITSAFNEEETIDICQSNKIKIIEVFSGYCGVCAKSLPSALKYAERYKELIDFYIVAKEYNSKEFNVYNEYTGGTSKPYYYFKDELLLEYAKLYNNAKPSYIVLNENNEIIEMCDGSLKDFDFFEIFGSLKYLEKTEEIVQ